MRNLLCLWAAAAAIALAPALGWAQQTTSGGQNTNAIATGVPFLNIGPSARNGGMGNTGVAQPLDANTMFWNVGALAALETKSSVVVNATPWLRNIIPDINLYYLAGHYDLGKAGTLGGSLTYFSLGEILFTDGGGISTGSFTANEFALQLGYGLQVTEKLYAGAALKYINSNLAGAQTIGGIPIEPANSVAGDIGLFYSSDFSWGDQPANISWGLNISNIGAKVNYNSTNSDNDFLPMNFRIGAAITRDFDEQNSLTFALDLNKLLVPSEPDSTGDVGVLEAIFSSWGDAPGGFSEEMQEITLSAGLEYWYNKTLAARLGMFYESPEKGGRQYVSLGLGLKYNQFSIDFAFVQPLTQGNPLQNTLRFGLGYIIDE